MDLTRRQLIVGGLVAGATATSILSVAEAAEKGAKKKMTIPQLKNEDFYKDGKFNAEAAGQAYFDMFNRFGYPIVPGQMIPEHRHMKTEKAGPKMEGWHVRYGSICTFGEGEPKAGWEKIVPAEHQGEYLKCKNYVELKPGECNDLAGAEQWHFMVAGPEGAIVSEYATYHDGDGLRFSHPKAKL